MLVSKKRCTDLLYKVLSQTVETVRNPKITQELHTPARLIKLAEVCNFKSDPLKPLKMPRARAGAANFFFYQEASV